MFQLPIKQIAMAVAAAAVFGAGWYMRGLIAIAELAEYKSDQADAAADQRELTAKVEAAQEAVTVQSSERLDQQAEQQQREVQYVDRKVIEYRDRWRDSTCRLPAEWLQLYNQAIGTDPVPAPTATGPATD